MSERFSDNSIYWLLVVLIAVGFSVFGLITSRQLPLNQRRHKMQKFSLIGIGIVLFCLPIFAPYISGHSSIEYMDKIEIEKIETFDQVNESEAEQIKNIERLKREVVELRNDLKRMNFYYSNVVQFFSTLGMTACIGFAFRTRDDDS